MQDSLKDYGDDFQLSSIKCLFFDSVLFKGIKDILLPQYFSYEPGRIIYESLLEFHNLYKIVPSYETFKSFVNKRFAERIEKSTPQFRQEEEFKKEIINKLIVELHTHPLKDKQYIESELITFCKRQAVTNAIVDSFKYIENGTYDKIITEIRKASQIGERDEYIVYKNEESIAERYTEENKSSRNGVIATGFPVLDRLIDGGYGIGELVTIAGYTGYGKSTLMMNIGAHAASLGYTVAHFSLELPKKYASKRYDCIVSKTKWKELWKNREYVMETVKDLRGQIILQQFPPNRISITAIEAFIEYLIDKELRPDVVIIDHGDLLLPRERSKEKRFEIGDTWKDMRSLGEVYTTRVLTATQNNRSAKDKISDTDSASEGMAKPQDSDIYLTVNRSDELKSMGRAVVKIGKNRFGYDGIDLPFLFDQQRGIFTETEEAKQLIDEALMKRQDGEIDDDMGYSM